MQKLNKTLFLRLVCALVGVLFLVRLIFPSLTKPKTLEGEFADSVTVESKTLAEQTGNNEPVSTKALTDESKEPGLEEDNKSVEATRNTAKSDEKLQAFSLPRLHFATKHPIKSVPSYRDCFPDVQDVQIVAAKRYGVSPVANRAEAERRKSELLYVGANPYYEIDSRMNRSIPYLVPRASRLLEHISRRFLDSLAVKQIPLHKIIVTSVLRTEEDVARLTRYNHNALDQSCHRYGTTFDISYNRFHTVCPPSEAERRAVRNDSLKFVLSEVLRDVREEGLCYIKYEVKQGCFHITVR